jgi:cellulose synthase/poly-beta-1,6-N-acetylglucosamine synthase-like glycosyltransferase
VERASATTATVTSAIVARRSPCSFAAFVRQSTRWNQDFLQVLFKGDWKSLPDQRQRAFAFYALCTPFIQSATGVFPPIALITMVVGHVPVWLRIISFLPLATVMTVVVEHLALQDFATPSGLASGTKRGCC